MPPSTFRHHGVSSLGFALRLIEPALLLVFSVIAYLLREGMEFEALDQSGPIAMTALVVLLYGFCSGTLRMYEPAALKNLLVSAPRLMVTICASFGFLLAMLFLFKISSQYSRVWLSLWFGFSVFGILALRGYVARIISKRVEEGSWTRKMVLLGINHKAVELVHAIRNLGDAETQLIGVYSSERKVDPETLAPELRPLFCGNFLTLLEHCMSRDIDDVVMTDDLEQTDTTMSIINRLNTRAVNVLYCLPISLISCMGIRGLPLVMISRKPMEGHSVWIKRMLDIIASGTILLLISPIMLVLALLVKTSSAGPVFFRQKRGGFNGKSFEMLKFRSMRVGAEAEKDENGKERQALKNDPRITPVGAFLRKSSLDELPQLINVLRGDMSLVGPRPHVPSHDSYYGNLIDTYASRHRMKPGITGWAQLNGLRGETDTLEKMAKRVEYDVWYTQNWSFWMDLKIIFLTPFVAVFQKSAY